MANDAHVVHPSLDRRGMVGVVRPLLFTFRRTLVDRHDDRDLLALLSQFSLVESLFRRRSFLLASAKPDSNGRFHQIDV